MRTAGMALALCLVLAGCGGGSDGTTKAAIPPATTKATKPTASTATTPTAKPTISAPTGVPAPEDLQDFQCFANDKGVWNAAGTLKNESKKSVTYQVTVFVGEANGKDAKATTKQYVVNATGSASVTLNKLPAADGATKCYFQVLAQKVAS